ncbi:MAG: hypothetical protein FD165_2507 [Gammaproteobacteria bacterium]|nr:MAG: hypothetical protein FD165_2507 [Gammaproteobacteria bacterium]TND02906.1 MAG: hypothetical protein FD120_1975 [Gammaproteobacteria bacterium]
MFASGGVQPQPNPMPTSAEHKIRVNSGEYPARDGLLHTRVYSQKERTRRAALAWLGFWLLAALSIPIVVAHLILIPAFLIAGPVVAYRRLKMREAAEKATGFCPVHDGEFTMELEAGDTLPIWQPCPECHAPLHLVDALVDNTRSEKP